MPSSLFLIYQGTEAVENIVLELSELKNVYWDVEAFSKMKYLKLLQIHGAQLMHDPKHLPNSLRVLDWSEYPSKSLPLSFQSNELVKLCLNYSKIERLWKGTKVIQEPLCNFLFYFILFLFQVSLNFKTLQKLIILCLNFFFFFFWVAFDSLLGV